MDFKKLLKYVLTFSICMIITKILPLQTLSCNDSYYISIAFTVYYIVQEMYMPTYKVIVDKEKRTIEVI